MRPTRLGVSIAGLSLLSLIAAGSTGNNLLYFLFAATAAGLALAALAGRRNVKKLRARIEPPERAFRGVEFSLRVVVEGAPLSVARMVRAVGPLGASEVVDVPSHGTSALRLRMTLPGRGRWRLDGLVLESRHPFGMFTFRRPVDSGELVVWPQSGRGRAALDDGAAGAGRTAPGTALAGDFYGPRPYATGDDVRSIHWKMSARAGRLVVAQYAASVGGKAMVRLAGVDDLSVERAAAECRTRLEAGATVGLIGAGLEVPPGAGTRQLDRILAALAVAGPGGSRREAPPARRARDEGPADSVELRRLTLLIGLVVYVSMFLIDDLSPTRLLMFAPLIPLGAWLHERGGPFPPARAWSVLSAVTLLYLLFVDWRISGVAMANAHLLGYLLANRLLSPWKTGELRQAMLIMFLAFFLVSGLTVSPWYFPAFLVWVGLGATWLALDSGANPRRPREWLPGLLRLSAAAGVLTIVLFMAVPRVEGLRRFSPFLASAMDKLQVRPQVVTGFTERVSLGYYGTLRKSSARVMRVHPDLPPRTELAAPSLYLRGGAFDRFDGRSWTKSRIDFNYIVGGQHRRTRGGRAVVMRRGDALDFPSPPGGDVSFVIELLPMNSPVLFTVAFPRRIEGVPLSGWFDYTDSISLAAPLAAGGRYRVYPSMSAVGPSGAVSDPRLAAMAYALERPADADGRIAALVTRWTVGLDDPKAKADAIVRRLRRDYSYSTYSDGRRTSLADFLFTVRRGNCEYFASAGAILLRFAGIPTRLVTGFRADDWNEWGRFYDVRQSAAHAWVEAWIPDRGWVLYDPTPEETGLTVAADEFARRIERWAEALEASWYRRVIGYDQYSQRDAIGSLRFSRWLDGVKAALGRLPRAPAAAAAILLMVGWGALTLERIRPRHDFERAERLLARAGFRRRPWQTAREFAQEVATQRPDLAAANALAEEHYAARWSGRGDDAAARERRERLLADIKANLFVKMPRR